MSISKYFDKKLEREMFKVRIQKMSATHEGVVIDKRSKGFKTLAEAEKAEKKLIVQVERELLEAESKGCRWDVLLAEWELAAKAKNIFCGDLTKQTIEDYVRIITQYCPEWSKLHISEIDRTRAWMALDKLEREMSISRRKRLRSAIDAVFKWAMLSGRVQVTSVPTEGFKTTRKAEEKMPEILNLQQIRTLLSYAHQVNHPWYPVWALALFTGMRSGELYGLQWDCVDFDNQCIFVHRNWTNRVGLGPTKGRYWRSVPIESSQVLSLLKELKLKGGNGEYVLPRFQRWQDGDAASILREFCIGAGLPSVRFHALRACFATQLIRDSVAPGVVMKICGWKDLKTMQYYIRLAGIEVKGATAGLKLLPENEVMGRVVSLFNDK